MPSVGYHDVTINSHYWGTTSKGTVQLCVGCTFTSGETLTGYIYFSPGTCRSSGLRDDGTPHRSMAERALNAVGFMGQPNNAQRQIGDDDLVDNGVRVRVAMQDAKYGGGVKIDGFYEAKVADPAEVNAKLDALFDPEQQPDDGWSDDSEGVPPQPGLREAMDAEPAHLKPGDEHYDVPTKAMMDEAAAADKGRASDAIPCMHCGTTKDTKHAADCPDKVPFQ